MNATRFSSGAIFVPQAGMEPDWSDQPVPQTRRSLRNAAEAPQPAATATASDISP